MSLLSGLWNCFILGLFCTNTLIILVLFFQIIWIIEFMRQNSWHISAIFFYIFYFYNHFNFFSALKNWLLFMTVAMSSHNQSAVNCSSSKIEGNFMHIVNYCYNCHFPGLEFTQLHESKEGFHSQGWGDGSILKKTLLLEKLCRKMITGNSIPSKGDALMYVVLRKAEKHMPYGELGCTTGYVTL